MVSLHCFHDSRQLHIWVKMSYCFLVWLPILGILRAEGRWQLWHWTRLWCWGLHFEQILDIYWIRRNRKKFRKSFARDARKPSITDVIYISRDEITAGRLERQLDVRTVWGRLCRTCNTPTKMHLVNLVQLSHIYPHEPAVQVSCMKLEAGRSRLGSQYQTMNISVWHPDNAMICMKKVDSVLLPCCFRGEQFTFRWLQNGMSQIEK